MQTGTRRGLRPSDCEERAGAIRADQDPAIRQRRQICKWQQRAGHDPRDPWQRFRHDSRVRAERLARAYGCRAA